MKQASLIIFALLILFSACNKEDDSAPEIIITEKPEFEVRLKKITTTIGAQERVENFHYDEDSRLEWIDDYNQDLFYHYDETGLLKERIVIQDLPTLGIYDTSLVQKFSYDPNGFLERKDDFNATGEFLRYKTFETDSEGRIIEDRYFVSPQATSHSLRTKYIWEDGNIKLQQDFAAGEELMHEWTYEYDDKVNVACLNQKYIDLAAYSNINNAVYVSVLDYTGLLDLIVNPMENSIEYLDNGLPKKITVEDYGEIIYEYE